MPVARLADFQLAQTRLVELLSYLRGREGAQQRAIVFLFQRVRLTSCVLLDNFLRPVLVRRTANLPLLLIFGGVIGGLIAYGLVGIFVGPVVLAVTYTLLEAWVEGGLGAPKAT